MRKVLMTMSLAAATACGGSLDTARASDTSAPADQALVERNYDATGFEGVSVLGPHRVTVVVGPAFSVRAEGQARTLERIEVVVENGTLRIRPIREDRWDRDDDSRDYAAAHFTVTLPRLTAASMVGSGEMAVDRVEGDSFAASVAGSGTLDVAALRVASADLAIAGSGDLLAHGSARRSDVSIAGSGNLKARELVSESASLSLAGSGDAALTVNGEADISIVGGGEIEIAGADARCSVSRLGSGNVTCARLENNSAWR
jgi:hypothetical protein